MEKNHKYSDCYNAIKQWAESQSKERLVYEFLYAIETNDVQHLGNKLLNGKTI